MKIRQLLTVFICSALAFLIAGSATQTPPSTRPFIDLSVSPLAMASQSVNIALALSVKSSMAGAAYRSPEYDHAEEYLGYWDPKSCYEYFDASDASAMHGNYFRRTGSVDLSRYCNTPMAGLGYSGNVLNYAATSSIDLLRFALTGGNRVLDSVEKTVLGRAFLPSDFTNLGSNADFPSKRVNAALVGKVTPSLRVPQTGIVYTGPVYFSSCNDLIYVGTSSTNGTCALPGEANIFAPLGSKPIGSGAVPIKMKAYVQVCDSVEGPTRNGSDGVQFCKRYPNDSASTGVYKPVGELQNNAETRRIAVFANAPDNSTARYGGVLRAPMKYSSAQSRDPNGVMQKNLQAEWDLNTGIFLSDPLSAAANSSSFAAGSPAFDTSGVVNYLNHFGSSGLYKTTNSMGELYYEALRYFQGLQPSEAAISHLTELMYDKFPIYKNWTDPLQNSCQRHNFILAIGDVDTSVNPSPGASIKSPVNVVDWTRLLAGFETGRSMVYKDALGRTQTTAGNLQPSLKDANLETTTSGATSSAYYWAGAAYWANTHSIRNELATVSGKTQNLSPVQVRTYAIDVDDGGHAAVAAGVMNSSSQGSQPKSSSAYLAGKYGWFTDANNDANPFITSAGAINNSEWEDPFNPDFPDGYTPGGKAHRLVSGIRKFFASTAAQGNAVSVSSISAQQPIGSPGSPGSPGSTGILSSEDIFASQFDPRDWSGTVVKSVLHVDSATAAISTQPGVDWNSGKILTMGAGLSMGTPAADPIQHPSERKIFTYRRDTSTAPAVAFTAANFSRFDAVMRSALNTNPAGNITDNLGESRVNYLRGDRSQESVTARPFRRRGSIMGDVINSGPIYKKDADISIMDDGTYGAFTKASSHRTGAVYVGANDGMLHAFRASDGKELFAYIPLAVAKNLNRLTDPAYRHTAFVDGVPTVGEVKIDKDWRTVLVSGMGGGAQGVFALDVTNPDLFEDGSAGAGKVLFEFTDQDDPMMGNVLTQPRLVKLKIPATSSVKAPTYKWFVAVSSGYNNYVNDGAGRYSTTGDQALFLLSLDKLPGAAWAEGNNYFKIVVPSTSTNIANGLANAAYVQGTDGEASSLYAGDLQGNLWKFDFSVGLSKQNISSNKIVKTKNGVRQPFFIAMSDAITRQPITVSPVITTALQKGVMIVFGTGKFLEQSDANSTSIQSIYGLLDSSDSQQEYGLDRSNLQQQTAVEGAGSINISTHAFSLINSNSNNGGDSSSNGSSSSQKSGWYFDLPNNRERIAMEGAQGQTSITFNSTIPSDGCSSDGNGRSYTLNALTGAASNAIQLTSAIGLLGRPHYVSIDMTETGHYSARRADGGRQYEVTDTVVSTGSRVTGRENVGVQSAPTTPVNILAGRLSWREIRNFKN